MILALVAVLTCLALVIAGILIIQIDGRSNPATVVTGIMLGAVALVGTVVCSIWLAVEITKAVHS